MGSKVLISFLLLACLISHTVSEQNANGDHNQLGANGDDDRRKVNGDGKEVFAEPTAIDPVTSERCCPQVMKPIVLTAKPRYKWIVVPPLSVT
uniref:Uncharacterized protein n=1 Tax=Anopheles atroparvus TaxID=41427 RepID=A0A182JEC9_ANOAO